MSLSTIDKQALQRALDLCADRRQQLDAMAREPRPWEEIARFAAYTMQVRTLKLQPWQSPPCQVAADADGAAGDLVRAMLELGISIYEPDPITALKEAEHKSKRKRK
jgi:hypothetical protein